MSRLRQWVGYTCQVSTEAVRYIWIMLNAQIYKMYVSFSCLLTANRHPNHGWRNMRHNKRTERCKQNADKNSPLSLPKRAFSFFFFSVDKTIKLKLWTQGMMWDKVEEQVWFRDFAMNTCSCQFLSLTWNEGLKRQRGRRQCRVKCNLS